MCRRITHMYIFFCDDDGIIRHFKFVCIILFFCSSTFNRFVFSIKLFWRSQRKYCYMILILHLYGINYWNPLDCFKNSSIKSSRIVYIKLYIFLYRNFILVLFLPETIHNKHNIFCVDVFFFIGSYI